MTGCTLGSFASFDGIDLDGGKMSSVAEEMFEIITSCLIHIKSNFNKVQIFFSQKLCKQIVDNLFKYMVKCVFTFAFKCVTVAYM